MILVTLLHRRVVNQVRVETLDYQDFQDLRALQEAMDSQVRAVLVFADMTRVLQCESKKSPLGFSGIFSQTVGNFSTKFYMPVIRSCLRSTTDFYSFTSNFDEVMPY